MLNKRAQALKIKINKFVNETKLYKAIIITS